MRHKSMNGLPKGRSGTATARFKVAPLPVGHPARGMPSDRRQMVPDATDARVDQEYFAGSRCAKALCCHQGGDRVMAKTAATKLQDEVELVRREAFAAGYAAAMKLMREYASRSKPDSAT